MRQGHYVAFTKAHGCWFLYDDDDIRYTHTHTHTTRYIYVIYIACGLTWAFATDSEFLYHFLVVFVVVDGVFCSRLVTWADVQKSYGDTSAKLYNSGYLLFYR
jgi:hypothetical protein